MNHCGEHDHCAPLREPKLFLPYEHCATAANSIFAPLRRPTNCSRIQRSARGRAGDELEHELEFEGAPAVAAMLQVRLPKGSPRAAAADVQIDVKGTSAVVRVPGYPVLEVEVGPPAPPCADMASAFGCSGFGSLGTISHIGLKQSQP